MAYTTINKSNLYFNTVTYSGNNTANRSITGVGFQPDLVWIKGRSGTYGAGYNHFLFDTVRGEGKQIYSNTTGVEATNLNNLYSFNSDGFSLGQSGVDAVTNGSSTEFVSWNWRGSDSSAVTNNSGSITTTVSANTTSGFSVFTYTGTGSTATVGHGLGVAPKVVIIKCRSGDNDWRMYHASLPSSDYVLYLGSTAGQDLNSTVYNGSPTSTTVGLKTNTTNNGSGSTYVGYAFAEVKGYSKFSSYTGNGSADGTFVYTGFKPAYVMIKQTNTAGNDWYVYDNKRETYNFMDNILRPNTTDADTITTAVSLDFLSNGIKMRGTNTGMNASGGTYIYMAFAEQPLVGTNNVPATAR